MGSNDRQFSLKWNSYFNHITRAFDSFRTDEDLVDVTLSCEGKKIRAHKILLSACSSYFKELFKENPCQHPVIIFKDIKFSELEAIITFIYQGEVNVMQDHLESFINIAELLLIQGLATDSSQSDEQVPPKDMLNTSTPTEANNVFVDPQPRMTGASNTAAATSSKNVNVTRRTVPSSPPVVKRQKCSNSDINSRGGGVNYSNERTSFVRNDGKIGQVVQNSPIKTEPLDYQEVQSSPYSNDSTLISNKTVADINSVIKQEEPDSWASCLSEETNSDLSHPNDMPVHSFEQLLNKSESSGSIDDISQSGSGTDKPHVCPLCGMSYKHKTNLYGHMKFHTGETMCRLCKRMLSTKQNLQQHMYLVHGCKLSDNNKN